MSAIYVNMLIGLILTSFLRMQLISKDAVALQWHD